MAWQIATLLLATAVLAGGLLLLVELLNRSRLAVRRRVIVNLRSSKGMTGVLWSRHGNLVVLKDVVLHEGGQNVSIDGDVVLERDNVDWIQILP